MRQRTGGQIEASYQRALRLLFPRQSLPWRVLGRLALCGHTAIIVAWVF